jgi:hypothetical protein
MQTTTSGKQVMVQGRIVWIAGGDLFKGDLQRDQNTKQPRLNAQGEQIRQYGFGLAVDKTVFQKGMGKGEPAEFWAAMHEECFTLFPAARANGQVPPNFAMKFKDGDTAIDDSGAPYSKREGYAGHIVLACTTSLPIKFFKWENGANIQINEGIKCGDYVNVQLTIKAHPAVGQGKAGLYMNPMAVQFLGWGKEIINTPSGDQIFGLSQPGLPPGASATPITPQGSTPLIPQAAPQQFAPPSYQQAPAPAAPQAPQPHHAVLPPQFQPPMQQQFAPPVQQPYMNPPPQAHPAPGQVYQAPPQQYAPPAGMPLPPR